METLYGERRLLLLLGAICATMTAALVMAPYSGDLLLW